MQVLVSDSSVEIASLKRYPLDSAREGLVCAS